MAKNYNPSDIATLDDETVFPDANVLIYRYWPTLNPDKFTHTYFQSFKQLQKQKTRLVVTQELLNETANRVYKEQ
jgi:predicted nucleic acid-binding protein